MADTRQANISSIETLEAFRSSLILFLTKARRSLDDSTDAVRRTRQSIQHDKRTYWENEARRRKKQLDQAQQELMTARISALHDHLVVQQNAVHKAKRALEEAEDKLRVVKLWNQKFDSTVEPVAKRLESFRQFVDSDLPKAVSFLVNAQRALDDYTHSELESPSPAAGATAAGPENTETLS